MPLTVTNVVEQLYRYLAKDQRALPFVPEDHPDLTDPLPEALAAINGALQQMAASAPVFAARQRRAAHFHAPASLAVSGLTRGAQAFAQPEEWQPWMAGCRIELPGDEHANRIAGTDGANVRLQFPHLSAESSGSARVVADVVELESDVIQVLPGVRSRDGTPLHAASRRLDLARPPRRHGDYGRGASCAAEEGLAYAVESLLPAGGGAPRLALTLQPAPEAELVIEYEARVSPGWFAAEDVLGESPAQIPVPAQFVEAIFLPLALWRFFGSSVMRNTDAPRFIEQQAAAAEKLLQSMRPQTDKRALIRPTW